jgi:PTH1 family peptidyl-tRNA hydrolase
MLLVVGLGNPGKQYASHRHNVGFMAVDALASAARADPFREKFSGLFARAEIGMEPAILLKPMTYMNDSGRSVQPALAFFKMEPGRMIVLHDELDLPFATVRLKIGGGHAGHNGLRSIIAHVGTGDFMRARIGVGRPPPGFRGDPADYVLSSFDPVEQATLPDILKQAVESVLDVALRGPSAAMNTRNARPPKARVAKREGTQGKPEGTNQPPRTEGNGSAEPPEPAPPDDPGEKHTG